MFMRARRPSAIGAAPPMHASAARPCTFSICSTGTACPRQASTAALATGFVTARRVGPRGDTRMTPACMSVHGAKYVTNALSAAAAAIPASPCRCFFTQASNRTASFGSTAAAARAHFWARTAMQRSTVESFSAPSFAITAAASSIVFARWRTGSALLPVLPSASRVPD